jgi:hypothetical protein
VLSKLKVLSAQVSRCYGTSEAAAVSWLLGNENVSLGTTVDSSFPLDCISYRYLDLMLWSCNRDQNRSLLSSGTYARAVRSTVDWRLDETCCLHLHGRKVSLNMETTCFSEFSVPYYQSIRRHIPGESELSKLPSLELKISQKAEWLWKTRLKKNFKYTDQNNCITVAVIVKEN